eukprot:1237508-Rhodomonas_salina.2
MWAPDGIAMHKGECWEVLKSLYGEKRAGADWKGTLTPKLYKFCFEKVFILRNPKDAGQYIIIVIYVRRGARRIRNSRSFSV